MGLGSLQVLVKAAAALVFLPLKMKGEIKGGGGGGLLGVRL